MTQAVAIVGAGRMAAAHAVAWAALGVPVRWVVSPRRRPALEAAPHAGWARDLAEALADASVTIVSVCTPTATHADLAVEALAAARHVLLEKPVALTLADALRVEAAAGTAPGVLMVAHVVRFFPGYASLARQVAHGAVGTPRVVRASRISSAPEGVDWLADEEQSGGLLVDFGIHDIDQACSYLGEPLAVTSLRATAEGAGDVRVSTGAFRGAVTTTIEYRDGGLAQLLSVSDLPAGRPFQSTLEVVGDTGVAQTDGSVPGPDPFVEQARYFLECIGAGAGPSRSPVASAVTALRVALAARESLETGRRMLLDPGE